MTKVMITVKHPLIEKQEAQQAFLGQLPKSQVRFHELLFSYGNVTYLYHHRATEFRPTQTDWEEWLGCLSPHIAMEMKKKGFGSCKTVLSFTHYK